MDKAELIITALQQRIGELVSNYEIQNAILRAEITQLAEQDKEKQEALDEYSKALEQKGLDQQNYLNEKSVLHSRIQQLESDYESVKKTTTKAKP